LDLSVDHGLVDHGLLLDGGRGKMKHTPGPWVVSSTFLVCDKEARVIANCIPYVDSPTFNPPFKEGESNAVLISAAPELLEACKVALISHPDLIACKNAILKAEGKK
jgi:hypothetical protein